jgi:hypothetical protein
MLQILTVGHANAPFLSLSDSQFKVNLTSAQMTSSVIQSELIVFRPTPFASGWLEAVQLSGCFACLPASGLVSGPPNARTVAATAVDSVSRLVELAAAQKFQLRQDKHMHSSSLYMRFQHTFAYMSSVIPYLLLWEYVSSPFCGL